MDEEPSYDISITSDEHSCGGIAPILHRAVEAALCQHGVTSATISVAIVNDDTMARLNEQHLQHEGPTDVLTFDLSETSPTTDPNAPGRQASVEPCAETARAEKSSKLIDGEIIVSRETALREAAKRGHPVEAELTLYAVHGVLHLLGYDDHDEEHARRMHAMEDELLSAVGLGRVYAANEQAHSPLRSDVSPAAS